MSWWKRDRIINLHSPFQIFSDKKQSTQGTVQNSMLFKGKYRASFCNIHKCNCTCMYDYVGFFRDQMLRLATSVNRLKSDLVWQVQEPDAPLNHLIISQTIILVINELTICHSDRKMTGYRLNKILWFFMYNILLVDYFKQASEPVA